MIPHRMAFFVHAVLGEDATKVNLAGFGGAVGLFALASSQLLGTHGYAGAIGTDIHHRRVAPAWLGLPLLPSLRVLTHPLHHALDLPGRPLDGAGFGQGSFRLLVARLIGTLQTDQPGPSGRVARLQAQRCIGWVVPRFFALMLVVIALQWEGAKQTVHPQALSSFALLAGCGLIGGIDAVGRWLEPPLHQRVGGLEAGGAHQHFQLLHRQAVGRLRAKVRHQLLDFLLLGQEELWRWVFFLRPPLVRRGFFPP